MIDETVIMCWKLTSDESYLISSKNMRIMFKCHIVTSITMDVRKGVARERSPS